MGSPRRPIVTGSFSLFIKFDSNCKGFPHHESMIHKMISYSVLSSSFAMGVGTSK